MSIVSTDPIADMLTRIRNSISVNKNQIYVPHSKIKESIAKLLVKNGFLTDVKVDGNKSEKILEITINPEGQNSKITEISRLSKPGRRQYSTADDIPIVKQGRGIVLISTSKGLMTGDEAKKQRLGGELICRVY